VHINGQIYRFSSIPIEPVTTRLGAVPYTPTLQGLELGAADAGEAAVSVSFQDGSVFAQAVRRGATVEGAPAVLYRYRIGDELEESRVWTRGYLRSVAYGATGEAAAASLDPSPRESDVMIRAQAVVTSKTWPTTGSLPPEGIGAAYPLVFGYPGHSPLSAVPIGTVPAPCVEDYPTSNRTLVVSDGRIDAGTVSITNETTGATQTASVVTSAKDDLLSAKVSTAVVSSGGAAHGATGDKYLIGFQDDATYGGGIVSEYTGEVLAGAGDVCLWLLRRAKGRVAIDFGAFEAHRQQLNAYRVDTWVNDPSERAWDWILKALVPWMSVRVEVGPKGLFLRPWRWDAVSTDAVAHLSVDRGDVARETLVQLVHPEPANEITVRFNHRGGKYNDHRTLSSEYSRLGKYAVTALDSRIYPHPMCAASQAALSVNGDSGIRPLTIELKHSFHASTALKVAEEHVWARAMPHQMAEYTGSPGLERIRVGDVVVLEDTEVGLHDRVALIDQVTVGAARPRLRLVLPSTLIRTATT
jgi:hypothetical protein